MFRVSCRTLSYSILLTGMVLVFNLVQHTLNAFLYFATRCFIVLFCPGLLVLCHLSSLSVRIWPP